MPRKAPLPHRHVTITTLTLNFNNDVGGGRCGRGGEEGRKNGRQKNWIGILYATPNIMRRADLSCCHFLLLRIGFLFVIMLTLLSHRFMLYCRLLRKIVDPFLENAYRFGLVVLQVGGGERGTRRTFGDSAAYPVEG